MRPLLTAPHHLYLPELSGQSVPPSCGGLAWPSVGLSVHPIGGFAAIASSLEQLKRTGGGSFSQRLRTPSCGGARGGLSATLDAQAHVLVAEPAEALLRLAVLDGETELAYEALVVGAMRSGYRCIPMRHPASGSPIDGCALLVHVSRSRAPSAWIDDHEELRETIARQQATIAEQAARLEAQARQIAVLTQEGGGL